MTYGDYRYPEWAEMLGLCLSLVSMVWVPLYALYYLTCKAVRPCQCSIMETQTLMNVSSEWQLLRASPSGSDPDGGRGVSEQPRPDHHQ